jgi:hypothetical protein
MVQDAQRARHPILPPRMAAPGKERAAHDMYPETDYVVTSAEEGRTPVGSLTWR